jgi:nucleoside-diphosphate-sugar epimerase
MLTHQSSSPVQPSRVVVLGARGFIGSRLVARLESARIPVVALGSSDVDLASADAVGALRDALRADDALVFLSALTPDKGKDIRTSMRNLAMGEHVCVALSARPCAHVIYVSSDAVYADDASPITELSSRSASTLYGLMHLMRERMLQQTVAGKSVPLAILRPAALYGAGDTHNAYGPNRFVRSAVASRKIDLFGGGEEKRDHVRIDDFIDVLEFALTRRSEGIVNVASGSAVSFREVADMVRRLVGEDVAIHTSARSSPITHRHFDIAGLVRCVPGFRPASLDEGLRLMLGAGVTAR